MMSEKNRRRHDRISLRLGVVRAANASSIASGPITVDQWWTRDVSVGGMYIVAPSGSAVDKDSVLAFELSAPPGEGYSTHGCRIMASGQVVRQIEQADGTVGMAVQFADSPTVHPS